MTKKRAKELRAEGEDLALEHMDEYASTGELLNFLQNAAVDVYGDTAEGEEYYEGAYQYVMKQKKKEET